MILHPHFDVNEQGHLTVGGVDAVALAKEFGTPAYILDENVIRDNCRTYLRAARAAFGEDALPLYASKALSFTAVYKIVAEEGLGIDCVSGGELYTAKNANFPAERIYFHGNNKTDADLKMALDMGVGTVVVDNEDELTSLGALAVAQGTTQRILLRITPGIDPHTHRAIMTGNVDSKFGSAIVTGQALAITKKALATTGVKLVGFHCHIGSQIFEIEPFRDAAGIMLKFIADVKAETGFEASELNLGGGLGVRYTEDDPHVDYAASVAEIGEIVRGDAAKYSVAVPRVILEPGRSLVAAAGATLYTVGSVKEIPGFRNYVSVDGGMPDNPRYALYQSQYTALIANKAAKPKDYRATVAGRCCESGDLIGEGMALQKPARGDILAVLCTGAYNYSMASNYNRIPRPPVILVRDGKARVAVRRETFADLVRPDVTDND
ncbi:MAG: diaminopimelate decarboxylase [Clostridia bacterium]|nr:diaminopimelate decarboxylase [Clostridia bacterium]